MTLVVSEGQDMGRRVSLLGSIGEPAHLMALAGWGKEGLFRSSEPGLQGCNPLGEERQQAGLTERTGLHPSL